jgi:uncharacterized damage-inducible protein DinB
MNQTNSTVIDPRTVELLWQYMVAADAEVLAAADSVGDEGYFREQGISLGSIHKLIVHAMDAQRIWLERLKGTVNPPFSDPDQIPRAGVRDRWAELHPKLVSFASEQTTQSLQTVMRFKTRKGDPMEMARGAIMLHVSDHATYHRGQLNSMIKLAGGKPSPVMVYTWAVGQGYGRAGWGE